MPPSYLLALLPPPELTARVQRFRTAHSLKDAAAVPHLTVKARSGLPPDLAWRERLQAVVTAHSPVPLQIGGPHLFGNGSAVYLTASGQAAVNLHLALLDALKPARFFGYEGPNLQLHLSLALARPDLDLPEVLAAAQAEFADLEAQPLAFTARSVTLMRKPGPGGIYAPLEEWPLNAESGPDWGMQETPVQETRVEGLGVQRRRTKRMSIDWGPFFLYFGVSGTDHGRAERMAQQFELEHFANLVTLTLTAALEPGTYVLRGLPDEANKRGWTVGVGGRDASGNLSDDGLAELRAWMGQKARQVHTEPYRPPA